MKHLKQYLVNEGTSDMKLWNAIDKLKDIMGADDLVEALCRAMSDDELRENLKYIIRMHDLADEVKI